MPLTIRFDHPATGHTTTITGIVKLEGVWCRPPRHLTYTPTGRPTHYALYKSEHSRYPHLVPVASVHSLQWQPPDEATEYRDGQYTNNISPEERRER